MDYFTSDRGDRFSMKALQNFRDIRKDVKDHLVKVYATLAGCLLVSAIGCYIHVTTLMGGTWSGLISFGLLLWLMFTDARDEPKRVGILMAFSLFEGLSVGPLVRYSIALNPSIVVTAFLGATTIFACFTAAALLSQKRSLLYMGGFLGSALMMMCLGSFANMFFQSTMFMQMELYFGLLIFCGYVAFDTQLIVHEAESGNKDFVKHSLDLFLDFVQIFVRLLIILSDKENKKRKDDE